MILSYTCTSITEKCEDFSFQKSDKPNQIPRIIIKQNQQLVIIMQYLLNDLQFF